MLNRCLSALQAFLFASSIWASAQAQPTASSPEPAFETASIRPAQPTPGCFSMLPPGGTQYQLTCIMLRSLVQMAYKTNYVEGGGTTLDAFYDLRASTPDGILWTTDSVRPMLRQLLSERFHLTVHPGTRELSGYALVLAKGGPKLPSVGPESVVHGQKAGEPSPNFIMPGRLQGRGVDPAGIAGLLSAAVRAPVADRTGLTGFFNVDLRFAPEDSTNSDLPNIFTAVQEQLGLQLKSEKITVHTVVIDHVDSSPTPN